MGAAPSLSEDQSQFYHESLCTQADFCYRLALSTTLNEQVAWQVVQTTFDDLLEHPKTWTQGHDPELILARHLWQQLQTSLNLAPAGQTDLDKPYFKFLSSKPRGHRFLWTCIDVFGMDLTECASILDLPKEACLTQLAECRRDLISFAPPAPASDVQEIEGEESI